MDPAVVCLSGPGLLTLTGLDGVGAGRARTLAERFARLGDLFAARAEVAHEIPWWRRHGPPDEAAWDRAFTRAGAIVDRCAALSIAVVSVADRAYPPALRSVADRPPVLFVRGRIRPDGRNVACIGTRQPSVFGLTVAERIATFLARRGFGVVSGLALGVDTAVHRAALAAGGHTVAVLGNGLDRIYPSGNADLAEEIVAGSGALVSEQPPGAPATPANLVARDRLQTGLAAGTVVMQTDLGGGPMHGVRFALLQGRLLAAAVPTDRHAGHPKSRGLCALTSVAARELAGLVGATGRYRTILERLDETPAAMAIRGREDYDRLLEALERAAARLGGP